CGQLISPFDFGIQPFVAGEDQQISSGGVYPRGVQKSTRFDRQVISEGNALNFKVITVFDIMTYVSLRIIEHCFVVDLVKGTVEHIVLYGRVFVIHPLEIEDLEIKLACDNDTEVYIFVTEGIGEAAAHGGDA